MELAEPFATDFNAKDLTVFKTDHWSVLVRKSQVTVGSLVLAANRCFISAGEMTPEEAAEFPVVVGRLEAALAMAFQHDRMNYLCLMMVDRHYHFHVLPRYESPRQFAGRDWIDAAWPELPSLAAPACDEATLLALRDYLSQYVSIPTEAITRSEPE